MFVKLIKKIKLAYLRRVWSYYTVMGTKMLTLSKLTDDPFELAYYFNRASECIFKGENTLALMNKLRTEDA